MAYNQPQEYIFLNTQTATTSASLSFTSLITSQYPVYYVKIRNLLPDTDNTNLNLLYSTNNGLSYLGSAYAWANFTYTDSTNTRTGASATTVIQLAPALSNSSSRGGLNANLWFYNLAQSKVAYVRGRSITYDTTPHLSFVYIGGVNTGTTAVNAIQFLMSSGNLTSGTITLYGMTI